MPRPFPRAALRCPKARPFGHNLAIRNISDLKSKFYIRLTVEDKLGVLAQATKIFADNEISISYISQYDTGDSDAKTLIYMTHQTREGGMEKAKTQLESLDLIREVASIIRIENIDAWTENVFAN